MSVDTASHITARFPRWSSTGNAAARPNTCPAWYLRLSAVPILRPIVFAQALLRVAAKSEMPEGRAVRAQLTKYCLLRLMPILSFVLTFAAPAIPR
jgi:hypothetical protein